MTEPLQLTERQRATADARARCTAAVAAVVDPVNPDGFVSIRDVRAAAKRAGTPQPDWKAERAMVRDLGFGWFKAGMIVGEWEMVVCASEEAARFHREAIDLAAVSRAALAWCLANRPPDHPIAPLARLAHDISIDDIHNEQLRPSYRQLLDGWSALL